MTYDCLLEREAWLGGGGHTMGGMGGGGGLRRGDAAPYIALKFKSDAAVVWFRIQVTSTFDQP